MILEDRLSKNILEIIIHFKKKEKSLYFFIKMEINTRMKTAKSFNT
jgi:hypothetical protein